MKKIGLVVAMEEEMKDIYDKLGTLRSEVVCNNFKIKIYSVDNDTEAYLIGSGIGEISAALATMTLINVFHCENIINFGLVGSLSSELKCGDVVLVKEIVHYDFCLLASDEQTYGKYPFQRDSFVHSINSEDLNIAQNALGDIKTVRIATGDKFVNKSDFKSWLINHFGAEICDMESMGIYLACRAAGAPCYMIKAVSDNADESAHEDLNSVVTKAVTCYIGQVQSLIAALK